MIQTAASDPIQREEPAPANPLTADAVELAFRDACESAVLRAAAQSRSDAMPVEVRPHLHGTIASLARVAHRARKGIAVRHEPMHREDASRAPEVTGSSPTMTGLPQDPLRREEPEPLHAWRPVAAKATRQHPMHREPPGPIGGAEPNAYDQSADAGGRAGASRLCRSAA